MSLVTTQNFKTHARVSRFDSQNQRDMKSVSIFTSLPVAALFLFHLPFLVLDCNRAHCGPLGTRSWIHRHGRYTDVRPGRDRSRRSQPTRDKKETLKLITAETSATVTVSGAAASATNLPWHGNAFLCIRACTYTRSRLCDQCIVHCLGRDLIHIRCTHNCITRLHILEKAKCGIRLIFFPVRCLCRHPHRPIRTSGKAASRWFLCRLCSLNFFGLHPRARALSLIHSMMIVMANVVDMRSEDI